MEILGVGPLELITIFILLLVAAGPKRMAVWAYQLGKYVRMLRGMWQDAMNAISKEIDIEDLRGDLETMKADVQKLNIVDDARKVINTDGAAPQAAADYGDYNPQPPSQPQQEDGKYDAWLPK
jgi:Sec-independent protein translocase protein TatA